MSIIHTQPSFGGIAEYLMKIRAYGPNALQQ